MQCERALAEMEGRIFLQAHMVTLFYANSHHTELWSSCVLRAEGNSPTGGNRWEYWVSPPKYFQISWSSVSLVGPPSGSNTFGILLSDNSRKRFETQSQ